MIWGLVNGSILLALMVILRPRLPWPREDLGYIVLWFLFAPLGVALYQGQSSIVLLGVYAACFLQERKGNSFISGLVLGLGLVKLQFVLPLFMIFLLRKKWSVVFGFLITALGLNLISVATVGWRGVVAYSRFLLAIGSHPQSVSYGSGIDMPTIHGLTYAILGHWLSPTALNLLAGALSLLLLVWVAQRWSPVSSRAGSDLMFASAISASLLAGSHMFTHDFSPLLVAMFVVGAQLKTLQKSTYRTLRMILVIFWTFPIYFLFVAWHCLFLMCPILLLFTLYVAKSAGSADTKLDHLEFAVTG